jgi:predicted RNA-binding protein with PIN domain
MALIVDAYNVLHCSHVLPERYALVSARGLCWMLDRSAYRGRIAVVCDGAPKPTENTELDIGRVELIYSGPNTDADTVIERLIEADTGPRDLLVVSNDHRIQRAARRRRAHVLGSEQFLRRLGRTMQRLDRTDTPPGPEKPAGTADPEAWMRLFGFHDGNDPAPPAEAELDSQTEQWMREFGFEPDDEDL